MFNFDSITLPRTYQRNGQPCYLDPCRKILIPATPEEHVRQKTIILLTHTMQVPLPCIDTEVPMTDFKKGAAGRADIVVYDSDQKPILIVECKSMNEDLTHDVYDQARNYDKTVQAHTLMITNGIDLFIESRSRLTGHYQLLAKLPTYKDLKKSKFSFKKPKKEPWQRLKYSDLYKNKRKKEWLQLGLIHENNSDAFIPFAINVCEILWDYTVSIGGQYVGDVWIEEDKGIRITKFGNAAGFDWTGDYRYFIIEDSNKNNQIISLAVLYGYLIVAIDDYKKKHNSLQLNLEEYATETGDYYEIHHNGRLTLGKKGAMKQSEVIDFVRSMAPELVDDNNRIYLGKLTHTRNITWEDPDTRHFFGRLIKYAIIRDQFRVYKQAELSESEAL